MATKNNELTTSRGTASNEQRRELRKSNEAIGLRVVEGKLTLLNRKLLNVLMYHAQEAKELGVNAPIDTPAAKKYFWVRLSQLAKDAHYDSNDTAFLKQQIKELQDIKLLLENDRQWTSERLIASVTITNPKGLKSSQGQVWVGFAFPPEVYETVMAPQTYTKLSILYQGVLRSGAALALYEICRRYATNPTKVTAIEPIEYWYGSLTGNPVNKDLELPPYKYFKRDVIKPAIAEINALTDINVELIEHKNGRTVERLQFYVEYNKQSQLGFSLPAVIDMELMHDIMSLGLGQEDAADLIALYDDAKLRTTLSFVRARMSQKGAAPLDSPAGYFKWALEKGAAATSAHQTKISRRKKAGEPQADGPGVMEMFFSARANDALELYKELPADEREAIYSRFKTQETKHKLAAFDKATEHGVTRSLLSMWYAAQLWGEPTAEDIARYIQQLGVLRAPAK